MSSEAITTIDVTPTVHLNGTSRDELVNNRRLVLDRLRDVRDRIGLVAPNGRDYPNQPDKLKFAVAVFNARVNFLDATIRFYEEEAFAISQQE